MGGETLPSAVLCGRSLVLLQPVRSLSVAVYALTVGGVLAPGIPRVSDRPLPQRSQSTEPGHNKARGQPEGLGWGCPHGGPT